MKRLLLRYQIGSGIEQEVVMAEGGILHIEMARGPPGVATPQGPAAGYPQGPQGDACAFYKYSA